MSIRIVTSFHTLLHLARKLYEAEQTGDANKIRLAKMPTMNIKTYV